VGTRGFKDYFSGHAAEYARHRPTYPPELFAHLAELAPRREQAWDCATGSGQAALALAAHFAHVIATDASPEQLSSAAVHARVAYRLAAAERSGIETATVDCVTIAQALHWFDLEAFYAEVRRVLVPRGVIAAWSYDVASISPQVDAILARYYREIVGPYWPAERSAVENGYRTLAFPFEELATGRWEMRVHWELEQLLGYVATWSASRRYAAARGSDPLDLVRAELERAWGAAPRDVTWPLLARIGRV
jgi:SAM-dependent methyltransferase